MEKKVQKIQPRDYNLLIAQDLWQAYYQIVSITFLNEFIKLDVNMHCKKKMKFSIKDFFSKCCQIRSFLWIWSHLLKISLMKNFIFCAVMDMIIKDVKLVKLNINIATVFVNIAKVKNDLIE